MFSQFVNCNECFDRKKKYLEFLGVLKKQHVEITGMVNEKEAGFLGVINKNSFGISMGLGFWFCDFQKSVTQFCRISKSEAFFFQNSLNMHSIFLSIVFRGFKEAINKSAPFCNWKLVLRLKLFHPNKIFLTLYLWLYDKLMSVT